MASYSGMMPRSIVLGLVVALAACSSDPAPAPTAAAYLAGLESVCAGTTTAPDELDDDHRALIQNDEEQAAAWSDLADAAGGPDINAESLDELTTTIAQLNLGRDDLVTEMGAPSCVRTPG